MPLFRRMLPVIAAIAAYLVVLAVTPVRYHARIDAAVIVASLVFPAIETFRLIRVLRKRKRIVRLARRMDERMTVWMDRNNIRDEYLSEFGKRVLRSEKREAEEDGR